jgi:hypothetical protein
MNEDVRLPVGVVGDQIAGIAQERNKATINRNATEAITSLVALPTLRIHAYARGRLRQQDSGTGYHNRHHDGDHPHA